MQILQFSIAANAYGFRHSLYKWQHKDQKIFLLQFTHFDCYFCIFFLFGEKSKLFSRYIRFCVYFHFSFRAKDGPHMVKLWMKIVQTSYAHMQSITSNLLKSLLAKNSIKHFLHLSFVLAEDTYFGCACVISILSLFFCSSFSPAWFIQISFS